MRGTYHQTLIRSVAHVMMALAAMLLGGCRNGVAMHVDGAYQPLPPGGLDFGAYDLTPKLRVGCLPYPGAFTLFEKADPKRLGDHAYNGQNKTREVDNGIVYTCRGGFIDIAHTRKTMDLCKFAAVRFEMALLNNWTALRLRSTEPSIYDIHLNYPPQWNGLPSAEKRILARELSIRLGQRMAMLMMTWHEVLTWFGYQAVGVLPERQSAFTYDDTGSHAFGVLIAGRALRDETREWDAAVTYAMNEGLRELDVVKPDRLMRAIDKVKGVWWQGFQPLKRQFETGLDGKPIDAWIVRGLPFCGNAQPYRYEIPRLDNVKVYDFSKLVRIEIHPNVFETGRIRDTIPGKPEKIDADKHLPIIMDYMRQWHVKRSGAQVLTPE